MNVDVAMYEIDVDKLRGVIGGCQCQQQAAPQQAPEQAAPAGGAQEGASGGGILGGVQQLLGLFQSDGFKQLLGGLQSLIGQGGQSAGAAPQQ